MLSLEWDGTTLREEACDLRLSWTHEVEARGTLCSILAVAIDRASGSVLKTLN